MLQEPIEPVFVCEVRDLALDYNSERVDTLFQLIFSNCESDALMNCADALGSCLLAALKKSPDVGLTTRANEKTSEGLLTGPLAWASGLLHIQLPACFPTISHPGGIWAASSRSPNWTWSTIISSLRFCQLIKTLSAFISIKSKFLSSITRKQEGKYLCERHPGHEAQQAQ